MSTQDSGNFFAYQKKLAEVAQNDVAFLLYKDATYKGSWKRGGGRSAWWMLRRKVDRLIELMRPPAPPEGWPTSVQHTIANTDLLLRLSRAEDVFAAIQARPLGEDGTVLAEVRDLRRYLLLVEADMVAAGVVEVDRPPGDGPDDENLHARYDLDQLPRKLHPREIEQALKNSGEMTDADVDYIREAGTSDSGKQRYSVVFKEKDGRHVPGTVYISRRDGKLWGEF